jgi:UrcA family protein
VSFAEPGAGTHQVTERESVSLAGLDVLTPEGLRLANWRIQQMAQRLCLQIVNIDERDAATCVARTVADAQRKLNAVVQARRAEREAHSVASSSKR